MLSVPSTFDVKARGVGTQVWKALLKRKRKSLVGSQWAGKEGSRTSVCSHGMACWCVGFAARLEVLADQVVVIASLVELR